MAGTIGTALMLLEASRLGAVIDINAIPRPAHIPLERWLTAFPSYGYLLSVPPENTEAVLAKFHARNIAAATIGTTDASRIVRLRDGKQEATLWRFTETNLIGCAA
jgi:selenophosphate synthetase-related protein